MISQLLFNPFRKIAGAKALFFGILIMTITAVVAIFSHCHFNGIVDAHIWKSSSVAVYFIEALIDWGIVAILFYLTGKLLSRSKIRLLDVAGTTALARFPYLFVSLISFGIPSLNLAGFQHINMIDNQKLVLLLILALVTIGFSVWMIVLLFQAFKISCNLKGTRLIVGFIGVLVIAEILSLIAFHYLYLYF